jgi:hypothetical protein
VTRANSGPITRHEALGSDFSVTRSNEAPTPIGVPTGSRPSSVSQAQRGCDNQSGIDLALDLRRSKGQTTTSECSTAEPLTLAEPHEPRQPRRCRSASPLPLRAVHVGHDNHVHHDRPQPSSPEPTQTRQPIDARSGADFSGVHAMNDNQQDLDAGGAS